ncbi:MAG: chemotaxis protein CheW, partial [Proteobacteria bacterium]|nr:chemotaxis protein CheW [Pseudomonadota bacterium]
MSSEHNKTSKEYLAFMIDGIHLAADIGMISEIVKTGNVELLAESGTLVSGVMQVRKDNVLIVELSTFINHKAQDGKLCIVVDYDGKRYGF